MKLKMQIQDLSLFSSVLMNGLEHVHFQTQLEIQLSTVIFKDLLKKLATKHINNNNEKITIKLSDLEVILLNRILPVIPVHFDMYIMSLITDLQLKTAQECLKY